jgi:LruC domain-containing protein
MKTREKNVRVHLFILAIAFLFSSCVKKDFEHSSVDATLEDIIVPADFDFRTSREVKVNVSVLDQMDKPVQHMRIDCYSTLPERGGQLLLSGMTDVQGNFSSTVQLPTSSDSLTVSTRAIGFVNMRSVRVNMGVVRHVFGGKPSMLGSGMPAAEPAEPFAIQGNIKALGSWNADGVPSYLTSPGDVITASFLAELNADFPEYLSLPLRRADYFNASAQTNILIKEPSGVYVTFLHEGAQEKHTLGFYTYKKGSPPATAADIDTIRVIFPNLSFPGSGGGLSSGAKVFIGNFGADTEIGWVLFANAFGNGTIATNSVRFHSHASFNPENMSEKRKHAVLLNDAARGQFILGFEEMNREPAPGKTCDDDFNDVVFSVKVDPHRSVDATGVAVSNHTTSDADKDGVSDDDDDHPSDPDKSFNNYHPSKNQFNVLAFEDLWPFRGDYDFNDLVVAYNINRVTNAQNKITGITATFKPLAAGASHRLGFGMQLPFSADMVSSVFGTRLNPSKIALLSNGCEAGQSKAVLVIFDDVYKELPYPGGSAIGVNTTIGQPYVQPPSLEVVIKLKQPIDIATAGSPPFNPFIFISDSRGKEVHLIDNLPTDKADKSLLGTANDKSDVAAGRYYRSTQNLPFAIDISYKFDHPVEKAVITKAYLKFFAWASSGGMNYQDWYKDKADYRNDALIFK